MSTPETRTAEAPMRYELREARNGRRIGFAILNRPRQLQPLRSIPTAAPGAHPCSGWWMMRESNFVGGA